MIELRLTPQAYPLACMEADGKKYLVIGWHPDGRPAVVPFDAKSTPLLKGVKGDVTYYLPESDVAIANARYDGAVPVYDVSG